MCLSARPIGVVMLQLLLAFGTGTLAQSAREMRGTAVDGSAAVLPGVTVVAATPEGVVLATTVTNETGGFVFSGLPRGTVNLTFHLEGFADVALRAASSWEAGSPIVAHLELAARDEVVVVHAPPAVVPLERMAPPVLPVPTHDRDSVCGPAKAGVPASFGIIRSRHDESDHHLYVTGDELVIEGGTQTGLIAGLNVVARRYFQVKTAAGEIATGEHTSGLLQIVEAEERSARAVVVYACDEMVQGDFLAAFTPEPVRSPEPVGRPAYREAARILFADAGQMLGVPRRLMVIDRGTSEGIRAGQRVTLFREPSRGAKEPSIIGDGVVVATQAESATIRVDRATDAVMFGDRAAPQHPATESRSSAAPAFPQP